MRNCESEEMYLETILILSREKGQVRRVDIAESMSVSKPSVTFAMRSLTEKGYVCDDGNGGIRLTDIGKSKAETIYERHHLITQLLMHIGADPADAEANACRIEHVVSTELTEVIRRFMKQGPVFG